MSEPLPETPGDATPQATWLARVHVTLKPVVLDPQGDAVLMGLHQLDFAGVSAVRVGKYLELTLAAADEQAAAAAVRLSAKNTMTFGAGCNSRPAVWRTTAPSPRAAADAVADPVRRRSRR